MKVLAGNGAGAVSNQLISLASRELMTPESLEAYMELNVSNQLISLASRELCVKARKWSWHL